MYILTTLEFPTHNIDFHQLTIVWIRLEVTIASEVLPYSI